MDHIFRMNKLYIELFIETLDGVLDAEDRPSCHAELQHLNTLAVHLARAGNRAIDVLGGAGPNRRRFRSEHSRAEQSPIMCDEMLIRTGRELMHAHETARQLIRTKSQADLNKRNCFRLGRTELRTLHDLLHYLLVVCPVFQVGRLRDCGRTSVALRSALKVRYKMGKPGALLFEEFYPRTSREKEIEDERDEYEQRLF